LLARALLKNLSTRFILAVQVKTVFAEISADLLMMTASGIKTLSKRVALTA
jgi:hypothetical protein